MDLVGYAACFVCGPLVRWPCVQRTKCARAWFLQRAGPFSLCEPFHSKVTEHMEMCLSKLTHMQRHTSNGEVLGLSLLLEDISEQEVSEPAEKWLSPSPAPSQCVFACLRVCVFACLLVCVCVCVRVRVRVRVRVCVFAWLFLCLRVSK